MIRKNAVHHPDLALARFDAAEAIAIKPSSLGQDFEAFLAEEGILESVKATAIKRVIAFRLRQAMNDQGLTKQEVAKRMRTSRSQLDRVLDPKVKTIQLDVIIRAAHCVGRKLTLTLA
jgi:predicted XRE-type DNA-binding protein